jgi:secreted protein with Ig-like and vWFA domain
MLNLSAENAHQSAKGQQRRQEVLMNHSIYSADRTTHLKIVVVALVAGIVVAGLGISARNTDDGYTQTARVVKAGKAVALTSSDAALVR